MVNLKFKTVLMSGFLTLGLFVNNAMAAVDPGITVEAKIYRDGCDYINNSNHYAFTKADIKIEYKKVLENGARVYLKYGVIGNGFNKWIAKDDAPEMTPVGPSHRVINLTQFIDSRGSDKKINKLGFVFYILYPNGDEFDNGHESTWGSYEVDLRANPIGCWHPGQPNEPEYQKLPITIHNYN